MKMKRFFKNAASLVWMFLAWIVLSSIFWGWIINIVTDTAPAKKITVFIEAAAVDDGAIADLLSEELPENIKMVKVHPFSYAFFDSQTLLTSDVFIVKESNIEQYSGSFAALPEELSGGGYEYRLIDGTARGIKVYDAASGKGILEGLATFGDEDCYLFIGASSVHLDDGAALYAASKLIGAK